MSSPLLPEMWRWITLGGLSTLVQYGLNEKADESGTGPIYLRISDIDDFGALIKSDRKKLLSDNTAFDKYKLVPGDIVIARSGSIGRSFLITENERGWIFASYLIRFRVDAELIYPEYLSYCLKSAFFKQHIAKFGRSVAQPNINSKELSLFKIPLPPLPEQERIVNILRQADKLNQVQNTFFEDCLLIKDKILGDILGAAYISKKNMLLGQITLFVTSGSRDWSRYYTQSKESPKFIRVQNIKNGVLDLSDCANVKPPDTSEAQRAKVEPNDILISITGTIGQAAFVPEHIGEAYISQHVAIIRTDRSLPVRFLVDVINHPQGGQHQLQRLNYGQIKPGLNLTQIREIKIPILEPNVIERYVYCSSAVETLVGRFQAFKRTYNELNRCLLNEAFTGNLTASWREKNKTILKKASKTIKVGLGISGRQVIKTELADEERPWLDQPNRHWLMNQLSDLQGMVYEALCEWKGTLLPSEDLETFREQSSSLERLENANDQILRALHQLADLGLVARISLDNQEGDYVTAFRGLREDEFSQVADRHYLSKG